jgi:hypothetical protein
MNDVQSRIANALRSQGKEIDIPISEALPCPYPGHLGRMFQGVEQLYEHHITDYDHRQWKRYDELKEKSMLREAALKLR